MLLVECASDVLGTQVPGPHLIEPKDEHDHGHGHGHAPKPIPGPVARM